MEQQVWNGWPVLGIGSGPPLVYLAPLTRDHELPRGLERFAAAMQIRPFARHRRVWWVNRRQGLRPGITMVDIAADIAGLLRARFTRATDVVGVSTGGSVALQLAADHPDVVRRLVLIGAASRLGATGRDSQRQVARRLRQADRRGAAAAMLSGLGAWTGSSVALQATGWLLGSAVVGHGDQEDLLATIEAEDAFDLTDRLGEVVAPTLVIGGERDACYSAELFRQTAAGVRQGRVLLYRGKGHLSTVTTPRLPDDVHAFLT